MRLFNIPQVIQQPTGETLQCFASGDEYFNWLHDGNGYIIIQDKGSGRYTYAQYKNGVLEPSELTVTAEKINSTTLKDSYPFVVRIEEIRGSMLGKLSSYKVDTLQAQQGILSAQSLAGASFTATTGTINNIVIFVRFKGEAEYSTPLSTYNNLFNNSTANYNSVYNYFQATSYSQLTLTSHFFEQGGSDTVISYEDAQVRDYYRPYGPTNLIGYQTQAERTTREQTLVANAILFAKPLIDAAPYSVDSDGDGLVDSIVLIVKGMPEGWADILWPHQWVLFDQTVLLQGARAWNYNFQLSDFLSVGVLCHELLHTLGYPDLYHYSFDGLDPVGIWDIMDGTTNPPQNNNAYTKYRYGKWIQSLPVITTCSNYSLNPLTMSNNNVWRINTPLSTTEYFVLEYRKKEVTMDSTLPGSGLLVYRINTAVDGQGNAGGPPDEVYLFRPGGTPSSEGNLSDAYLTSDIGRTSIGGATSPLFLSDGTDSGIVIRNIGSAGSTISFDVQLATCGTDALQIQKQATPSVINPGETLLYEITITNAGSVSLQNIDLSDTIPPELLNPTYALAGNPNWYPWQGSYQITSLGAGGSVTLLIRGNVQFLGSSTVSNTAIVTLDGQQKTSSVAVTINNAVGDLQVTKTASADPIGIGEVLSYQITVTNTGSTPLSNVCITDQVPSELTNPIYQIQGNTAWCKWQGCYCIDSLAPNQSITLIISGIVAYKGYDAMINTAIVKSGGQQKTSSVVVRINKNVPTLQIIKTASCDAVQPGQVLIYTIAIRNNGVLPLQNILVTDTTPTELQNPMNLIVGDTIWNVWSGSYTIATLGAGAVFRMLIKGTVQNTTATEIVNTAIASAMGQDVSSSVTVALCIPTPCCNTCGGQTLYPESGYIGCEENC
ncbi:MAG: M6 family metalloprotease domain-containing protein [Cellulosilyticaceae bacterium]